MATTRGHGSRHLDSLHRLSAAVLGLGLLAFGILGLANRLDMFSTSGAPVLGLSTDGLLSIISLLVGAVLLFAAVRGGRAASTITVVVGAAFLLSGVGNVLVLDTPLNLLAFRMSNVIFSLVAGGLLLILGAYGRFTGRLPNDNLYNRERHPDRDSVEALSPMFTDPADQIAARELAAAERAVSGHAGTARQQAGAAAASWHRTPEDRVEAWRASHPAVGRADDAG
jgi:Domain of unknown function (DUF4383)